MKSSWLGGFLFFAFLPLVLAENDTIPLSQLDFPSDFPIKSENYSINYDAERSREPGFLKFRVTSFHANYEVEGISALRKVLLEIEVIERLKKENTAPGVLDGAADSIEATGEGISNLVTHPIQSAKGLGKAAGKIGGAIGGAFRKKEDWEKTSFSEKMLGSSKRELAKQLQLDVYSDNPNVQKLLDQLSKSRIGGKGIAAIGTFFIPAGALSIAVTAGGVNSAADELVNDHDKIDLFRMNRESLIGFAISKEEAEAFLNSVYFSPRDVTHIRFDLEKLKSVQGFREILKRAAQAKSRLDALKMICELKMAVQDEKIKWNRLQVFPEGLLMISEHQIRFFAGYDYLDSSVGDRILKHILDLRGSVKEVEIWNSAQISRGFYLASLAKGVKTKSWRLSPKPL